MRDFLTSVFLESPLRLGILSFLLLATALLLRRRATERTLPYILPGALALVLLLFIIQSLVVTDREQIISALGDFVGAVESRDAPRMASHIDDAFDADGLSKAALLNLINDKLAVIRIYDTSLSPEIRAEGDTAEMILGARATVSLNGGVGEFHAGTWSLRWTRHSRGWAIIDLRPVRLDTIEIGGWRELRSLVP
jgi:hypothetical protein